MSCSLRIDPTVRHTFWCLFFGGIVYWTQTNAVSQNMIQRYLSLPSLGDARKALCIFCVGVLILMALCGYNGLLIYATYQNCDPLTTKVGLVLGSLIYFKDRIYQSNSSWQRPEINSSRSL